jgi:hypothetical protein
MLCTRGILARLCALENKSARRSLVVTSLDLVRDLLAIIAPHQYSKAK